MCLIWPYVLLEEKRGAFDALAYVPSAEEGCDETAKAQLTREEFPAVVALLLSRTNASGDGSGRAWPGGEEKP